MTASKRVATKRVVKTASRKAKAAPVKPLTKPAKRAVAKVSGTKNAPKKAAPTHPQIGWLNKRDMAASCGISVKSFDQWNVEPIARIGREVFFTVSHVLTNRAARADQRRVAQSADQPDAAAGGEDLTLQERIEKLLLTREQREGQALKNAQTRRELAPVGVIQWTLASVGSQISAILGALPLKMKRLIPALTATEVEHMKREIAKAQNAAARVTVDLDEYYADPKDGVVSGDVPRN